MANFDGLLGEGSAARQLLIYGVGYELARSLLGPLFTQIGYLINENQPLVELDPATLADLVVKHWLNADDGASRATKFGIDGDRFNLLVNAATPWLSPQVLADMVVRNIRNQVDAVGEAEKSGILPADFADMVKSAGEPIGLEQALEAFRRGYIAEGPDDPTQPSLITAVKTGRVYDYWEPIIKQLRFTPPSPADAVRAVLRNQIGEDEGVALAYFGGLGVDELVVPGGQDAGPTKTAFDILVNSSGNPPSLTELLDLARRQIIPWGNLDPTQRNPDPAEISFAQGIYEGDSKDKWLPYYAKLGEYLPPPRTIITLLADGSLDQTLGRQLLAAQGLTPELAAIYLASSTATKVAKHKELALATVEDLYFAQMIDEATATSLIEPLGYDATETSFLIALVDMRRALAALNAAINRIGSYYTAHKLNATDAGAALARLGVPDSQATQLISTWDVTRTANVKLLTESQIVDAWSHQIMTQDEAMTELAALGYTPYDAWVVLSVKAKTPLPNQPPPGPAGVA